MHSTPHHKPQAWGESVQSRRVHTITDRFSMVNTYLVNEKRLFVINPGTEENIRLLFRYVQHVLRRPIQDIDLIVLTHWNADQRASATVLQHFCHAPIAASIGLQQMLAEQRDHKSRSSHSPIPEKFMLRSLQHLQTDQPPFQISIWLHDVEGLPSHPDWRVIASPGHTPESLCLYNPFSRELLCSDTVMTIRRGNPVVRGSKNPVQVEETIRILRSLPVSYLYPGHGRAILSHRPFKNLDSE